MLFDSPDWNAFKGYTLQLRPGLQIGQEATVDMRRRNAGMIAHFLKGNAADGLDSLHLVKPRRELDEAHTAALEAAGLKRATAACD